MELYVQMGGHRAAWHFPGSASWRAWVACRPWLSASSVTIQVASVDNWDWMWPEFERGLVIAGWPDVSVLTRRLRLRPGVPFAVSACEALDAEDCQRWGRARLRDFLAEASCNTPVILVASIEGEPLGALASLASRQQEAAQLAEAVVKGEPTGQIATVLVIASEEVARAGDEPLDFRYGSLAISPSALLQTDMRDAWAVYQHMRICWEVGGNFALAQFWEQSAEVTRPVGNDVSFEEALCRASADLLGADGASIELIETMLKAPSSAASVENAAAELVEKGLARCPRSGRKADLCPWVARAILTHNPAHPRRTYLRARLRCEPLAGIVLACCATMEARLRAEYIPQLGAESTISEDTRDQHRRFVDGQLQSLRPHYPSTHPSPPSDLLEFSSFGEWQRQVLHLPQQADDLRRLRNAMAHGHYCSWFTVSELRRLNARLG